MEETDRLSMKISTARCLLLLWKKKNNLTRAGCVQAVASQYGRRWFRLWPRNMDAVGLSQNILDIDLNWGNDNL